MESERFAALKSDIDLDNTDSGLNNNVEIDIKEEKIYINDFDWQNYSDSATNEKFQTSGAGDFYAEDVKLNLSTSNLLVTTPAERNACTSDDCNITRKYNVQGVIRADNGDVSVYKGISLRKARVVLDRDEVTNYFKHGKTGKSATARAEKRTLISDYFGFEKTPNNVNRGRKIVNYKIESEDNCSREESSSDFEAPDTHKESEKKNENYTTTTIGREQDSVKLIKHYCEKCDESFPRTKFGKQKNCYNCSSSLQFQCGKCKKTWTKFGTVYVHCKSICGASKLYKCKKCDYSTGVAKHMEMHIEHKHTKYRKAANSECSEESDDSEKYTTEKIGEKKGTDELLKIYCEKCDKSFLRNGRRKPINCLNCNMVLPFECLGCKKNYASYESIYTHIQNVCGLSRIYKCKQCDHSTSVLSSIKLHIKIQHTDKKNMANGKKPENDVKKYAVETVAEKPEFEQMIRFYCKKCDNSFPLNKKRKSIDCPNCKLSLSFQCAKCEKIYTWYPSALEHCKDVCGRWKVYKCNECYYNTGVECHMKDHIKSKHTVKQSNFMEKYASVKANEKEDSRLVRFYCKKCDVSFPRNRRMKPIECLHCKSMVTFQCAKCKKSYEKFRSTAGHCRFVCGRPKVYKCTECDYMIGIEETMIRHIKCQHTDKKHIKKSDILSKYTTVKMSEEQEERAYIDVNLSKCRYQKEFVCKFCPFKTEYLQYYKHHLKTQHATDLKDNAKQIIISGDKENMTICENNNYAKSEMINVDAEIDENYDSDDQLIRTILPSQIKENKKTPVQKLINRVCKKCNVKEDVMELDSMNILRRCKSCQEKMKFQCKACERSYSHTTGLKLHFETVCNKPKYYECDHCERQFQTKYTLLVHIFGSHMDDNNYVPDSKGFRKCSRCNKKLRNKKSLLRHLKFCGTSKCLKCKFCSFTTNYLNTLKDHMRKKHRLTNEKEIAVQFNEAHLQKIRSDQYNMSRHLYITNWGLSVEENQLALKMMQIFCTKCSYTREARNSNPEKCPECSAPVSCRCLKCRMEYKIISNMKYHCKRNHLLNEQQVDSARSLTGKNNNADRQNNAGPTTAINMNSRYLADEEKSLALPMMQAFCEKYNHAQKVILERNCYKPTKCDKCKSNNRFRCLRCSKEFKNSKSLGCHVKREYLLSEHRPTARQYQCGKCSRRFSFYSDLQQHWTHCLKAADMECDYCKRLFKYKHTLVNHIQTLHLGIKPKVYVCKKCKTKFKHAGRFESHKKSDCLNMFYWCDECGKKYKSKTHLIKHIKSKQVVSILI